MPKRIEFGTLTNEERKQLEALSRSTTQPYRVVERAKMVTLAYQGQTVEAIGYSEYGIFAHGVFSLRFLTALWVFTPTRIRHPFSFANPQLSIIPRWFGQSLIRQTKVRTTSNENDRRC